ncbi:methyl-accepting chemotaxis protein [Paenibacillus massiliensis]|uniref:methyl-accepting chemotaxis protein n=1 Tax=Paenibacillus massiliensis TaxID=225917 RepID=UPI00046F9A90|nr:methyl-accepting chemotaxis protein [Paenibacillus massiliensis]
MNMQRRPRLQRPHFHTVRVKTLASLLPAFIITLLLVTGFSYWYSGQLIQDQIKQRMSSQLSDISGQISGRLNIHSKLPEVVARSVEGQSTTYTLEQYRSILTKVLASNSDSFGVGIYFEPFRYDSATEYFSTYAYREGQGFATTEEYSDPSYDYPSQNWYKNGMQQQGITPPYYDPGTDSTMATFSYPFFADDSSLSGVITGDLNLATIQQLVEGTAVGTEGWATLLDGKGNYLADPDQDKVMKLKLANDPNSELAGLATEIMGNDHGMVTYTDAGEAYRLYYQKLPESGWVLALTVPERELFSPLNSLLLWISVISIGGVVIAIISVLLYSRMITGNLQKVNALSKHLSQGEFTSQLSIAGKDEFAAMAVNLNGMILNIRELLEKIGESSHQVASASQQLSTSSDECSKVTESVVLAIQEVASGSETQRLSTGETATAMEEMAAGVQRVVNNALTTLRTTASITEQAEYGGRQMKEAATFLKTLEGDNAATLAVIQRLDQHSGEINHIVHFISELSSQTNLLALNASIEAARAGEHGKSFAVVAREVQKLAERSSEAAHSISELIKAIQQGNADASQAMTVTSSKVGEGAHLATEAERIFEEIVRGLADIHDQSNEISSSSQQLMAGSQQIHATVDQLALIAKDTSGHAQTVAAASEEQLASMQQVASSSAALSHLAQELQQLTARFKVD